MSLVELGRMKETSELILNSLNDPFFHYMKNEKKTQTVLIFPQFLVLLILHEISMLP